MFVRIVNLFFLILCAKLCIIQGRNATVNEIDYLQFKKIINEQISLLKNKSEKNVSVRRLFRKLDQSTEGNLDLQEESEFFLGDIRCSRYNIEKKTTKFSNGENNNFLKFVWTFADEENATVKISVPISDSFLAKASIPVEKRGELYFVTNCIIPKEKENLAKEMRFVNEIRQNFQVLTNTSRQLYKSHEILIEKRNLKSTTESKFLVKNSVDNLNIIVLGNISKMDLRIPDDQETLLEWNENGKISDLMHSLKRMTETKGLQFNVRNPPSGEWFLKLTPVEGSNYRFIIATVFNDSMKDDRIIFQQDQVTTDEFKEDDQDEIVSESRYNEKIVDKPTDYEINDDKSKTINTTNEVFSKLIKLGNDDEPRQWKMSDEEKENWLNISNIFKLPKIFNTSLEDGTAKELGQETNLESRIAFPEEQYSNEESNDDIVKMFDGPLIEDRFNHESLELDDLTRDASDNFFQRKVLSIDVSPDTNLIVRAGAGIVRINFDVKNNQLLASRICYGASGSPLRAVGIFASNPYGSRNCHVASPGQVVTVGVEILVGNEILDTVNTVTLTALVVGFQPKSFQRTVNLLIQNSNTRRVDDTRPIVKYYFNNNCGGHLREDKCSRSIWSVEITVQDVDSGLKSVTSSPSGIQTRTDYVSGTTNQVSFFYYATCCHQTVQISAIDMYGNYNNRLIDVTEWDNLSDGEIAAIVMGVLFIILLIILIVLLIIYCVKRSKSRDLPYTQRYGSGPPAQRPERTSF